MSKSEAKTCPFVDRYCTGTSCMAWIINKYGSDKFGYCSLLLEEKTEVVDIDF